MVLKICMQIECSQNNFCQLFCINTQAIFWALLMSKCTCVCSTGSQLHMFSLLDMVPPGVLCCLLKTHVNLFKFCLTGFLGTEQVFLFCLFYFFAFSISQMNWYFAVNNRYVLKYTFFSSREIQKFISSCSCRKNNSLFLYKWFSWNISTTSFS